MAALAAARLMDISAQYPIKAVWSLAGLRVFDAEPEALAVALDLIGRANQLHRLVPASHSRGLGNLRLS